MYRLEEDITPVIDSPKHANMHFWAQLTTSIAAVIVSLLGVNIEGFSWLLYFCIPLLLVPVVIAISLSPAWSNFCKKQVVKKDEKKSKNRSRQYVELVTDISSIEQLINKISNYLEWGAVPRIRTPQITTDFYWFGALRKEKKTYSAQELVFLNHIVSLYMSGVESYLSEVDSLIISGKITYKYHIQKAELIQNLAKLYAYRDEHDKFCNRLNDSVATFSLRGVYGNIYSFEPLEKKNI